MTEFSQLKEKTQKLLNVGEDSNISEDLTASVDGRLIFLTNVFEDGCVLGFWSHSPWGNTHNQEEGWAVLSVKGEVLSSCETKTSGLPSGNDFKKWRSEQRWNHGKSFKLCPEWENENFWKITDC